MYNKLGTLTKEIIMKTSPIQNYENLYIISEDGKVFSLDRNIIGSDEIIYPKKGKELSISVNKQTSYLQVDLWKNGKGKRFYIHRLLAITFITNPYNKPEVNHIDGNKQNNCLENLEWVTSSENSIHALETKLVIRYKKFTDSEYESMLQEFLTESNLTQLAKKYSSSLTSFSYWIREAAERLSLSNDYDERLKFYKGIRAKASGILQHQNVIQYSLSGEYIQTFCSLTSAANYLGKSSAGAISNCISGRTKSGYGFIWKRE